jgi:hypothetical protein
MSDLLREIDEELQREHMAALWHKYKIPTLGFIALLVLGTASYSAWQDHKIATATKRSVALSTVLGTTTMTDPQKSEAFLAFATSNAGSGQAALARMAAINALLRDHKTAAAVQELDVLANDATAPSIARDYARLSKISVQFEQADPAQLRQQLAPLAADGQPWRYMARLLQGALLAKTGEPKMAQAVFGTLAEDQAAPTTLREQAKILARYYATQG